MYTLKKTKLNFHKNKSSKSPIKINFIKYFIYNILEIEFYKFDDINKYAIKKKKLKL